MIFLLYREEYGIQQELFFIYSFGKIISKKTDEVKERQDYLLSYLC